MIYPSNADKINVKAGKLQLKEETGGIQTAKFIQPKKKMQAN